MNTNQARDAALKPADDGLPYPQCAALVYIGDRLDELGREVLLARTEGVIGLNLSDIGPAIDNIARELATR